MTLLLLSILSSSGEHERVLFIWHLHGLWLFFSRFFDLLQFLLIISEINDLENEKYCADCFGFKIGVLACTFFLSEIALGFYFLIFNFGKMHVYPSLFLLADLGENTFMFGEFQFWSSFQTHRHFLIRSWLKHLRFLFFIFPKFNSI